MTCGTCHHACDCREAMFAESVIALERTNEWSCLSDAGLRLRCGEMTAAEIRLVRGILKMILER